MSPFIHFVRIFSADHHLGILRRIDRGVKIQLRGIGELSEAIPFDLDGFKGAISKVDHKFSLSLFIFCNPNSTGKVPGNLLHGVIGIVWETAVPAGHQRLYFLPLCGLAPSTPPLLHQPEGMAFFPALLFEGVLLRLRDEHEQVLVFAVEVVKAPSEYAQLLAQRLYPVFVFEDHVLEDNGVKSLIEKGWDILAPFSAQFRQRIANLAVEGQDVQGIFF